MHLDQMPKPPQLFLESPPYCDGGAMMLEANAPGLVSQGELVLGYWSVLERFMENKVCFARV